MLKEVRVCDLCQNLENGEAQYIELMGHDGETTSCDVCDDCLNDSETIAQCDQCGNHMKPEDTFYVHSQINITESYIYRITAAKATCRKCFPREFANQLAKDLAELDENLFDEIAESMR